MPRMDAASGPPSSSRASGASRISSSVSARRGPRRRGISETDIRPPYPLDVRVTTVEPSLYAVQMLYAVQGSWTHDSDHGPRSAPHDGSAVRRRRADLRGGGPAAARGPRRATGALFVAGALTFAAAATVLSSTFEWPDILREPADVVLPAFAAGGTSLVWTWFATAWTAPP